MIRLPTRDSAGDRRPVLALRARFASEEHRDPLTVAAGEPLVAVEDRDVTPDAQDGMPEIKQIVLGVRA